MDEINDNILKIYCLGYNEQCLYIAPIILMTLHIHYIFKKYM